MSYIHYGSTNFNKQLFTPIKNHEFLSKPKGGLWGSPIEANFGWKEWCEAENFRACNIENSFKFILKADANILVINSVSDLDPLPKIKPNFPVNWICLDFEKLIEMRTDAVQLNLSNDTSNSWSETLYFKLYGWDCDSIIIMNPDIIQIKERI